MAVKRIAYTRPTWQPRDRIEEIVNSVHQAGFKRAILEIKMKEREFTSPYYLPPLPVGVSDLKNLYKFLKFGFAKMTA